ncbi:MAG TPA: lipoprotein signal peptidase [Chryseolinea sp.]|nr:lipoprotein signal peptidase [Chryseolinea sp.]
MKIYRYFILALAVIVIDQVSKLLVHQHMFLHQEITVLGSEQYGFKLHYLLNPGMAFGIRWNNEFGKLALTVFRIAAMVGIGYYLIKMAKRGASSGFLWCMSLILGGAVGNVIDSTFYGVLLNNHPTNSPTPWFHGQVIDMLFFPLFDYTWPEWFPFFGGDYFLFFSPVFNIADSSIFMGVVIILLFQRRFFGDKLHHDDYESDVHPTLTPGADSTSNSVVENPEEIKP